uniref:Uncharacterized protein n=1 Tax=Siphoviridae sp. ctmpG14 TaxID=2825654 RepID=A0A8S5PAY7_9CAUD|nr:MAG TPA: hypothetical protein [Siphoviridae sp. ctmpG14]
MGYYFPPVEVSLVTPLQLLFYHPSFTLLSNPTFFR